MKIKKSLLVQGSILAAAGLITKIIGFVYRIPMANILGNTGNGIYSVAFGIYNIALTLSSYGMPVSVSKLIAEKLGKNNKTEAEQVFKIALLISTMMGLVASLGLFCGADYLAVAFDKEGLQFPLRVLAPTTFIVSILGCFRGYHQGYGDMIPTSVSQIVEQIINAIISIIAASTIVIVITEYNQQEALKAAGGTFGTLCGAVAALIMVLIFYFKKKNKKEQKEMNERKAGESGFSCAKTLMVIMIPIMISQTVYQIGFTLDDYLFANLMKLKSVSSTEVTNLQGVFNTQYTQFINLPVAIATAFGVSVIPMISRCYAKKDKKGIENHISQLLRVTLWVVIPSAIGISLTANETMKVLYPNLGIYSSLASKLLLYGSSACVFYALGTVSTNILQGCGKVSVPVINSIISLFIHVVIVCVLITKTDLGVYSLLIGDISFPLIIGILNLGYIVNKMDYYICFVSFVKKIILATIFMGLMILVTQYLFTSCRDVVLLIIKITVGVVAYIVFFVKKKKDGKIGLSIE